MVKSHTILEVPTWYTQPWLAAATSAARDRITFPRKHQNLKHQGPLSVHGDVSTTGHGIPFLRNYLEQFSLDKITKEWLMSHTWRKGTVNLYTSYLRKWDLYCLLQKVKPLKPSIAQILRFLRFLENEGLGFSAINAARCALSIILPRIDGETVGKHQLIHWFLRSVYTRNPPKPKYSRFWDVSVIFTPLKSWPGNQHLSLKNLSIKVAILLLLTTGHRGQTISHYHCTGWKLRPHSN